MSNISVNTITDASGGSTASINGLTPQASNMQPHNLIINGDMRIAQAATSITTIGTGSYQACDRWRIQSNLNPTTHTLAQVADAPDGFKYSSKLTVGTGATPTGNDFGRLYQRIEVQDVKHLQWGTSNPQPITLSFWVKASVTGTYGGTFAANGTGIYVFAYDVIAANVWEYKTYTVTDGMTTFVTDSNDNGIGFGVHFDLGEGPSRSSSEGQRPTTDSGSMGLSGGVKILATSGATFYITGVQLEAGSFGSSFAHENVGDTLQKCQRYYYQRNWTQYYQPIFTPVWNSGTNTQQTLFYHPVQMRGGPTCSHNGVGNFRLNNSEGQDETCNAITFANSVNHATLVSFSKATANLVIGKSGYINAEGTNDASFYIDAEL